MPTEFDPNNNRMGENRSLYDLLDDSAVLDRDERLWQLLNVYMDGEATPEEASQVEALLRSDPDYGRELAFLRFTSESARAIPEVEPPAFLRESILAATTRRPRLSQRLTAVWDDLCRFLATPTGRAMAPVGALAAAALVTVVLLPHHQGSQISTHKSSAPSTIALGPRSSDPVKLVNPPSTNTTSAGAQSAMATSPKKELAKQDGPKRMIVMHTESPPSEKRSEKRLGSGADRKTVSANSSSKKLNGAIPHIQSPGDIGNDTRMMASRSSEDFSPRPGMDEGSYRALRISAGNVDVDEVDGAVKPEDPVTTLPPVHTAKQTDSAKTASSEPNFRPGRLLAQQPPDTSQILTSADIKREREAATLGYSSETIRGMKRHEAVLAFSAGKF